MSVVKRSLKTKLVENIKKKKFLKIQMTKFDKVCSALFLKRTYKDKTFVQSLAEKDTIYF